VPTPAVPPHPGSVPRTPSLHSASPPAALGLRNPLGVQSPYSAAFGLAHPAVNGDVAGSGAYASLHLMSPQLNGAAAAGGYGRSPLVSDPQPQSKVPTLPVPWGGCRGGFMGLAHN
uniref:Uncharacterized protein n=1 Tax=Junco hyemalis TaxID=40217 RepID=A0A8C5IV68_JUNHY